MSLLYYYILVSGKSQTLVVLLMKNKSKLYLPAISALFAALCTVFVYFIHIPNGLGGYTHAGDMFVYLAASMLPTPYAAMAGGVGFALADLISGYPHYMLPSAIIRIFIVLLFSYKQEKILCKRNYIALPLAAIITIGGYAITKYFIYILMKSETSQAAIAAAVASIPGNIMQCIISSAIFIMLSLTLDKLNFKKQVLSKVD